MTSPDGWIVAVLPVVESANFLDETRSFGASFLQDIFGWKDRAPDRLLLLLLHDPEPSHPPLSKSSGKWKRRPAGRELQNITSIYCLLACDRVQMRITK